MAADLDDLKRLKVTEETKAWLHAKSLSTGRRMQEIARDALHEIAVAEIRAARILANLAPAEARAGDDRGLARDNQGRGGRR